jgi:hypothetical protein
MMQTLLVTLIVAGCAGYAVWVLMPSALRRVVAQQALRLHWPRPIAARLQKAAKASTGCGCDGCDAGTPKPAANASQPIRIHRQPKSRP